MSARDYRTCPQCIVNEQARRRKAMDSANAAYGKVPADEYQKLVDDTKGQMLDQTLAEYYEVGVDKEGRFYVRYSGGCQTCDYEFQFKTEQQTTIKESP